MADPRGASGVLHAGLHPVLPVTEVVIVAVADHPVAANLAHARALGGAEEGRLEPGRGVVLKQGVLGGVRGLASTRGPRV